MKMMLHLVITILALGAFCFHSSQARAETSIEIRLTLLPAAPTNSPTARWTLGGHAPSSELRAEKAVDANGVQPLLTNSEIAVEQPARLLKVTMDGRNEVLVLPITIRGQDGKVPDFQPTSVQLHVILPYVPADTSARSAVGKTFQSVPLQQLQPLPRAIPVLKRARIPGDSAEAAPSQR